MEKYFNTDYNIQFLLFTARVCGTGNISSDSGPGRARTGEKSPNGFRNSH